MRGRRIIWLLVLVGWSGVWTSVFGQAYEKEVKPSRIIWTERPNWHTGLFTTRNMFVTPGLCVNMSAFYYYGDVDNRGVAFKGGVNKNNISGGLSIAYQHPFSKHCNMRFTLLGGMLRGNNMDMMEQKQGGRTDYRKFQSVVFQPSAGIQVYPADGIGFYLYGGVGLTASYITNFSFISSDNVAQNGGGTICLLPMVQFGIGYTWLLSTSWSIGLELLVNEGLCDTYYFNLDAWPLAASQSPIWQPTGLGKTNYWNDGFFQFGVTFIYQWRNCESCQIINNYAGIRPRRRK